MILAPLLFVKIISRGSKVDGKAVAVYKNVKVKTSVDTKVLVL